MKEQDVSFEDMMIDREGAAEVAEVIERKRRDGDRKRRDVGAQAPGVSERDAASRRTYREADACRLEVGGSMFVMRFPYNAAMVEAARHIPGRRWDHAAHVNTFPFDSAPHVRAFMSTHGHEWEISSAAQAKLAGELLPPGDAVATSDAVTKRPARGSVDLEDRGFAVYVYDYDEAMVAELRDIPGRRWVPERRVNTIAMFGASALRAFLDKHDGFEVSTEARQRMEEQGALDAERKVDADALHELSRAHDADLVIDGLGGTLKPFQCAGVAYMLRADGRAMCGDDMGTGKTVQVLGALEARQAFPAVVVCPASVKRSWRDHVMGPARWYPTHPIPQHGWLPERRVIVLSGRKCDPVLLDGADVIVLNYDILAAWEPFLSALPLEAVVFDESHYAKSKRAARTKAALALSKSVRRGVRFEPGGMRLCTTGTSVVNRPAELISQLELMDRLRDFGGASAFRKRYCESYWDGYRWDDRGASNEEELNRRLRETCFIRRTKAEVMPELPAKQPALVPVKLSNQRDYDRAEQETIKFLMESVERDQGFAAEIAELPVHERVARVKERQQDKAEAARRAEKLVRMNLLRKVCAQGKIKAAVEWVREFVESDSKLIVFAHHIEVQKALLAEFDGAARILGEDSSAKRGDAIDRFQTDDACKLIVCSLKAAREGITLTAASDVATIELDWTPATHDQAEDRSHRMGQVDSVTCWYLLAENTIDDDMMELIEGKREVTSAVMDGERKRREMNTSVMGALEERLIAKGLKR